MQGVQQEDWRQSGAVSARLDSLLAEMTLAEKIELVTGDLNPDYGFYSAALPRVGIPELTMADGPSGVRISNAAVHGGRATALPAPIALAATWNLQLAERYGDVLGGEARASGHNVLLGPAVDIARVPVGGRTFESSGEDPLVNARIAATQVEAIQRHAVMACLKHYAVNNQEFQRASIDVRIDEQTLRSLYLLPFEIVVRSTGLSSVMAAYNQVNGSYACEHAQLLTEVLRHDWGFGGWVVSDYRATQSTVPSALAGLDQEQPSGTYFAESLRSAVEQGDVPLATLNDMCRRILRPVVGLGLMENVPALSPMPTTANRAVALAVAQEAVVLLKNEGGLLPAIPARLGRVAVIGCDADSVGIVGGGSGVVRPAHEVSMLEGLRTRLGSQVQVDYAQGSDPLTAADLIPGEESIPSCHLRVEGGPHDGSTGLLLEMWPAGGFVGEPLHTRVVPQAGLNLGFFNLPGLGASSPHCPGFPFDLNGQSSSRFTGLLHAPQSGDYVLSVSMIGTVRIWIDDALVLDWRHHDDLAAAEPPSEAAFETAGAGEDPQQAGVARCVVRLTVRETGHRLRIEYEADAPCQGGLVGARFRLGWRPPADSVSPLQAQAVALARDADLVVLLVRAFESEQMDRPSMRLPNGQEQLIRRVAAANPNTLVVMMSAGPVDTTFWERQVRGLMHAWYLGQEQGTALAGLICGDVNPSGKLPITFPSGEAQGLLTRAQQYPGVGGQVFYEEGLLVGYRGFDARGLTPRFPFGHGLSYTSFTYEGLEIEANAAGLRVACNIKNSGERAGSEVAQLYLSLPVAGLPPKHLADWRKLNLAPGESQRVVFDIRADSIERPLSVWDLETRRWRAVGGPVGVLVGASSADIRLRGEARR